MRFMIVVLWVSFCLSMVILWLSFYRFSLDVYPQIFSTLSQLQTYAEDMNEYPSNDTTAWATPVYTNFWRKHVLSRWDRFLSGIRIRSWPLWHTEAFKKLMDTIAQENELNGYIDRFVVKLKPTPGSHFVIWGDVQGAFHSLVRDLTDLRAKGFINEQLQIIRPYVYFVFNGDLVNRGPYSLEVLTVVMRLMERNPQRIFYIRGQQEDAGQWKNFNLKDELIIRVGSVEKKEIPLGEELDRFFNTLPLALYLVDKETDKSVDVVRISNFNRKSAELNEEMFSDFFQGPYTMRLTVLKLGDNANDFKKKISVPAIIEGENRASVYRPSMGLVQLEADKGATAWTLLSAPVESYRHLQDFYFDAFVILDIGKQVSDWTLTLYNQDVRELLGIQRYAIFNLVTGLRDYQKEKNAQQADPFVSLRKQLANIEDEMEEFKVSCPAANELQREAK